MRDYIDRLKTVANKKELDLALEGYLHDLAQGMRKISASDVAVFGSLAHLFSNYYNNVFPDSRQVRRLNEAVFNLFEKYIKSPMPVEINQLLIGFPSEFISYMLQRTGVGELRVILLVGTIQEQLKKDAVKRGSQEISDAQMKETELLVEVLQKIEKKLSPENLQKKKEEFDEQWEKLMQEEGTLSKTKASLKAMNDYMERIEEEMQNMLLANPPPKYDTMTVQNWIEVLSDGELFDYKQTIDIDLRAKVQAEVIQPTASDYNLKEIDKQKNRELEQKLQAQTEPEYIESKIKVKKDSHLVSGEYSPQDAQNFESTVDFSSLQVASTPTKKEFPPTATEEKTHYEADDIIKDIKSKHKSGQAI